ncbi:MAG: TrkH family potassium uptake protein, partial [Pseudomonadota bacterium]
MITLGFVAAMIVPCLHGFWVGNAQAGRSFLYTFILSSGVVVAILVAISNQNRVENRRSLLFTLVYTFAGLPVVLAVPMVDVIGNTTLFHSYLDMVSAITTTALPIFDDGRLPETLVLWRSIVAWLGGLFIWVAAWSIFMPLRLGGFEMLPDRRASGKGHLYSNQKHDVTDMVMAQFRVIAPLYGGFTLCCAIVMMALGQGSFAAMIYAMGALSTAGYSPADVPIGIGCEWVVFIAMGLSVTRASFGHSVALRPISPWYKDSELKLAAVCVSGVTLILFLRQYGGAVGVDTAERGMMAMSALWGAAFTALSFLTTTGYVGQGWFAAQNWSGLSNPAIILMALTLIGGGVAT